MHSYGDRIKAVFNATETTVDYVEIPDDPVTQFDYYISQLKPDELHTLSTYLEMLVENKQDKETTTCKSN